MRSTAADAQPRAARGVGVDVHPLAGRADLARFIDLPWHIYADDPHWVPPLRMQVRDVLDPRRHPFHEHAQVESFLARRGGQVVGRISAIVNHRHNEFHRERTGFFGLFESVDDDAVAQALLDTAAGWLRARGMESVRGPMNLSTNDELYGPGVLIDGFDSPPLVMMPHAPRYYQALLEQAGYTKSKDLLAYWVDASTTPPRLLRTYQRIQRMEGVTMRALRMKELDAEVARIQEIYNSAWERNWGFVPMTEAEIRHLAKELKPVVAPELCALLLVDGEPVGFALALPDYNQAMRRLSDGRLLPFGILKLLWYRRRIDAVRTLTLGLKPAFRQRGFDAALIAQVMAEARKRGRGRGECSWILEDNVEMRNGLERLGGVAYKRYRVYEQVLQS